MELTSTLSQVKDYLRQNSEKGCLCPACNQHVQIYKRSITSSMGAALILLSKMANDNQWFHLETYLKSSPAPASWRGDVPKLRFWGLIEKREGEKEDGNPNDGIYRITPEGRFFVHGHHAVKGSILMYNNKKIGYPTDVEEVTIQDVLGKKFNYSELMEGLLNGV